MVLTPWLVYHLNFDMRFAGFHGYDCDMAMQVRAKGKRTVVVDVDTHHHTTMGFKTPDSMRAWHEADTLFRKKWNRDASS